MRLDTVVVLFQGDRRQCNHDIPFAVGMEFSGFLPQGLRGACRIGAGSLECSDSDIRRHFAEMAALVVSVSQKDFHPNLIRKDCYADRKKRIY